MFLILLNYAKPLEDVERHIGAHVAFLDKYYAQNKFIFSGRRNPRTGGVILTTADSLDEVQRIVTEDPFHQHGIAEYEIIEFFQTKYDPRFAPFVQ